MVARLRRAGFVAIIFPSDKAMDGKHASRLFVGEEET